MTQDSLLLPLVAASLVLAFCLARVAGRGGRLRRRDLRRLLGVSAVVGGAWLLLSALQAAL